MIIKLTSYDVGVFNKLPTGKSHDCLFYDDESGDVFLVELDKRAGETAYDFANRCVKIACQNFDESALAFEEMVTCEFAEILGYDTY
jgi:hypothetical protein